MISFLKGPAPFLNSVKLISGIGESLNRASIFIGDHVKREETKKKPEGEETSKTVEGLPHFSSFAPYVRGSIFFIVSSCTLPVFAKISMIFHLLYFAKDTISHLLEQKRFPPIDRTLTHAFLFSLDAIAFKFSSAISLLMAFINFEVLPRQISSVQKTIQAYGGLDKKDFEVPVAELPRLFYERV